jgi:hypothetical protein
MNDKSSSCFPNPIIMKVRMIFFSLYYVSTYFSFFMELNGLNMISESYSKFLKLPFIKQMYEIKNKIEI